MLIVMPRAFSSGALSIESYARNWAFPRNWLYFVIAAVSDVKAKGDEKIGVQIVCKALESPIRQIVANCGLDGSVVADEVRNMSTNTGYDANAAKYVDMYKAGIIDPAKVVRCALENAASVAKTFLTSDVVVTQIPEPEPVGAGAGAGDFGGY